MKKLKLIITALFLISPFAANADPIDLNNFQASPSVAVSPDGTTAEFLSDMETFEPITWLRLDPLRWGDPDLIIAGEGVSLVFDYVFDSGVMELDDLVYVSLILGSSPTNPGEYLRFFSTDVSGSGQVTFDLSDFAGQTIGLWIASRELIEELNPPGGAEGPDFDTVLVVSNLRLVADGSASVPEPGTLALLGLGLVGMAARRRKKV